MTQIFWQHFQKVYKMFIINMTDDDKNEWMDQSTIQAKESRLAFSAICEQRDWSVWVQAADSIRHKVLDGKDKISWSFIDPCGDIKSVSQEMKGFRQGKLNLTDMTLKLIPLQWHHTIPTNTVLKVASARSSRWPPKGISHLFFFLLNLLIWQRAQTVGKHHKAITVWPPRYWFSYFCTIKWWRGSGHAKKQNFVFLKQQRLCLQYWLPWSSLPAFWCIISIFSLFLSLGFVPGMPRHINVCV